MIANRSKRRGGFGLIEMAMTGLLLAIAMVATMKVVGWIALDRRASERRERAVLEASNLLERITATPWDDLKPESFRSLRVSDSANAFLAGPTLDVQIVGLDDAPARKKISVEVRWRDRSGRTESPVRLVACPIAGRRRPNDRSTEGLQPGRTPDGHHDRRGDARPLRGGSSTSSSGSTGADGRRWRSPTTSPDSPATSGSTPTPRPPVDPSASQPGRSSSPSPRG